MFHCPTTFCLLLHLSNNFFLFSRRTCLLLPIISHAQFFSLSFSTIFIAETPPKNEEVLSDEYANYYNYNESENSVDNVILTPLASLSYRSRDHDIAIDSDGRYKCICGKTYKEERYLRHHQRWECGKLPTFHCGQCTYKAKRKNSLKSHIKRRH